MHIKSNQYQKSENNMFIVSGILPLCLIVFCVLGFVDFRKKHLISLTEDSAGTNVKSYSSLDLRLLRSQIGRKSSLQILTRSTVESIISWNIHRKKRRGKRGGKPKHRSTNYRQHLIEIPLKNILDQSKNDSTLSFATFNARSVKNKHSAIAEYAHRKNLDWILLTETWIKSNDHDKIWAECSDLNTNGFTFYSFPRQNKRGGGLGLMTKSHLKTEVIDYGEKDTFEFCITRISINAHSVTVIGIYHPPLSTANSNQKFINEFSDFSEKVLSEQNNILFLGDFNLCNRSFLTSLSETGLEQHVKTPTHEKGNILDLVINCAESSFEVTDITQGPLLSDHFVILGNINWPKQKPTEKTISFRKFKDVPIEKVVKDMNLQDINFDTEDINVIIQDFENRVENSIDNYAPITTKTFKMRENRWYNNVLREQKIKMRKKEKIWRKYKQNHQLLSYKAERLQFLYQLRKLKKEILLSDIIEHRGDSKYLYKFVSKLWGQKIENPLPKCNSDQQLAENFAEFFISKIQNIRKNLENLSKFKTTPNKEITFMTRFQPVSEQEVTKVISKMKTKSCESDCISTKILKNHLPLFIHTITKIVNVSLDKGAFPTNWKIAILRPLLKKKGLDLVFKNYRPVSNLPFLSKVLEKIVINQVLNHCLATQTYPEHQSAYIKDRSCETALLHVTNTILWAMEKKKVAVVVAMDLSAAFDTVDHSILLDLLKNRYGLDGVVHDWFGSFLAKRSFKVCVNGVYSDVKVMNYSVPQGSAGGGFEYNLYAAPLIDIVPSEIDLNGFADDHTITDTFLPTATGSSESLLIKKFELCMSNINEWMGSMRLQMNPSKTELIYFGSQRQLEKCQLTSMMVESSVIDRSKCIRLLGVFLDENLSFHKHIGNQCRKAIANYYRIKCIRQFITKEACEILVHSLIMSHLDYGNCLLYGTPKKYLQKLQRIQNMAAKLVLNHMSYRASATEARKKLHWLPISERIEFQILINVFKCLHNNAPHKLSKLIIRKQTYLNLRSNHCKLFVPQVKSSTQAWRSFSVCGPRLWNLLPENIRKCNSLKKFKSLIKTYLFKKCYP